MGTIAITPLVDGAFVLTTTLNNSFRQLGEINGSLNAANVATIDRLLDYTYIQLGAVSGGLMVGGTANLDYFNNVRYVFDRGRDVNNLTIKYFDNGHLSYLSASRTLKAAIDSAGQKIGQQHRTSEFLGVSDAAEAPADRPKAIPGASTTFYLPYRAHVLITWQVTWTSDAARFGNTPTRENPSYQVEMQTEPARTPDPDAFPQPNVAVRFFFDGTEYAKYSTTRESRETMFAHQIDEGDGSGTRSADPFDDYAPNGLPVHKLRDRHKSRYWSGHAYVGIKAKGFHTASLRVISREIVRQTRVRARNIKVLYFKA